MKVMVMVKATADSEAGVMPSEQLLTEMGNYNEALVKAGIMLAGEGLHPSSRGARVRFAGKERTVIDGPFAETKELVAGFWIWQVKSLEEAIDWVKRCPNPMPGESEIEIRPIFSAEDFGEMLTPELREQEDRLRAQTEKLAASSQAASDSGLRSPRFEARQAMTIAGLLVRYNNQTRMNIPAQWERFVPHLGKVPGQVGTTSYGVCLNFDDKCEFDYLTGVEVDGSATPSGDLTVMHLPAARYAVIAHNGHVSAIGQTIDAIWSKWLPASGLQAAATPSFERYDERFDPRTGLGGIEIWVAIQD
ncbi:MAG: GyrI-like domain-containing protein [Pirellulales bacterium]